MFLWMGGCMGVGALRRRLRLRGGRGRFADACVVERVGFRGCSVMVWGGIFIVWNHCCLWNIAGNLTAIRYRDEVLCPVEFLLCMQQRRLILQHDNIRYQAARVCRNILANHKIITLDWPPYSLDLFPIEHPLDELDRMVRRLWNIAPLSSS